MTLSCFINHLNFSRALHCPQWEEDTKHNQTSVANCTLTESIYNSGYIRDSSSPYTCGNVTYIIGQSNWFVLGKWRPRGCL